MDTMYKFVVSDVGKIDLDRIMREAEGREAVLVSNGEECWALLSNEFLAKFSTHDDVMVLGEYLSPNWGYGGYGVDFDGDKFLITRRSSVMPESLSWRKVGDVAKFRAEMRAAIKFERQFTVTVHWLDF